SIYGLTDKGTRFHYVGFYELLKEMQVTRQELERAMRWLQGENLIELSGQSIGMTHWGNKAVETRPDPATLRQELLHFLYKVTEGQLNCSMYWTDIAEQMGVEPTDLEKALDYLENKGLITQWAVGSYGISVEGIDRLERGPGQPHTPGIVNVFQG